MPPTLSQSEVDALMEALQEGDLESDDGSFAAQDEDVQSYDFASRDRIVRGRMPTLDVIHGRLAHRFSQRLSALLKMDIEIIAEVAHPMKLGEFLSYLSAPACINLLALDPLQGAGLVSLQPDLFFLILDSIFGGTGPKAEVPAVPGGRTFTSIELDFAAQMMREFCEDMESAWAEVHPIKPAYLQTEVSPDHVAIGSASDVVMSAAMTVRLGEREGKIDLAIPYASIEPIKPRLVEQHMEESSLDRERWLNRLRDVVLKIELDLKLELGKTDISVIDLLRLQAGDVVRLDRHPGAPLPIMTGKRLKAWGTPLEVNGNLAFQFERWRRDEH